MYDVIIIGAGIIGSSIAWQLGKFRLKVLVVEKENDVAMQTSKANSGIVHSGYDCIPHTLKARLNVLGSSMYPELAKKLQFPYKRIGSLVLAFNEAEERRLHDLFEQGVENGVDELRILGRDAILAMEPAVNPDVIGALYSPSAAITCPYEATLAFAQNAAQNQVEFKFDYPVVSLEQTNDGFLVNGELSARYIVNAAGLYSDEVAKIANDYSYTIEPRKGEYLLLDKQPGLFRHILFQVPSDMGKGILITPTIHDNILLGPTACNILDKEDVSVSADGIREIITKTNKTSTEIPLREVIAEFSGVRAVLGDDFIIEASSHSNKLIHLIGICSPGLASAPAIAVYVRDLLQTSGLEMVKKEQIIEERQALIHPRDLNLEQYDDLVARQPLYGKIVCRCECISEQEIIEAITGILPARTVDGVKRRTRSGMGRCQGGFCGTRVMELLSMHQNRAMVEITKSTNHSHIVIAQTKGGDHDA